MSNKKVKNRGNISSQLSKIYYSPGEPGSFSGVQKLLHSSKKLKKNDLNKGNVTDWLKKEKLYTLFRKTNNKFLRSRIMSPRSGHMWDADLMNLYSLSKYNRNQKYVLLCIDVFSRMVYTEPLTTKNADDIVKGFKRIFTKAMCKVLRTDAGKEFTAVKVQDMLKSYGIKHYVAYNEGKASYAERAIRTIKNRLTKYMIHNNTYRWVDVLQKVTTSYNNTVHSSINIAPLKVNKDNTEEVFKYQYERVTNKALREGEERALARKKGKSLHEGDHVRLAKVKGPFTKDYEPKYTEEVFVISKRSVRDGIPVFHVKDLQGEIIKGSFYGDQLQKIVKPKKGDYYEVEKILKSRTKPNGEKQYLLKFRNYSNKFNEWVSSKDMKNIKS